MSSTASVNMRTCFSHWSLKTSMLSWATLLWGRAARVRAALMTCSEGGSALINWQARGHTGKEWRVNLKASASQHATWIFQVMVFSSCAYRKKIHHTNVLKNHVSSLGHELPSNEKIFFWHDLRVPKEISSLWSHEGHGWPHSCLNVLLIEDTSNNWVACKRLLTEGKVSSVEIYS